MSSSFMSDNHDRISTQFHGFYGLSACSNQNKFFNIIGADHIEDTFRITTYHRYDWNLFVNRDLYNMIICSPMLTNGKDDTKRFICHCTYFDDYLPKTFLIVQAYCINLHKTASI